MELKATLITHEDTVSFRGLWLNQDITVVFT